MYERNYKQLPLKYSDFGILHRQENQGSIAGLTRGIKLCQDDAHIFCTEE